VFGLLPDLAYIAGSSRPLPAAGTGEGDIRRAAAADSLPHGFDPGALTAIS